MKIILGLNEEDFKCWVVDLLNKVIVFVFNLRCKIIILIIHIIMFVMFKTKINYKIQTNVP